MHVGDHVPSDDAFSLEPGGTWVVDLRQRDARRGFTVGAATGDVRPVPKPRVPRSDRRGAA